MKRTVILILAIACLLPGQDAKVAQLFQTAVAEQQQGDFASAVRDYGQLLKLDPSLVDARANLAASLVHLNRFDEAIEQYRLALKSAPDNSAIRLNLALAFYKHGDFGRAARELAPLHQSNPADARVATLLADCYVRLQQDTQAIAVLRPLAAQHSDDLDLSYVLGAALIRTGAAAQGVQLIETVARRGNSPDAYLLAGAALLKLGEKARAIDDLQAGFKLNPDLPGLCTQLGIAREGSGDPEGAEADFRRALQQNPDDFDANVHLGGVLYTRRDLDGARTYIDRAARLRPDSPFVIYEMALLKNASGQTAQAVADLEKVERDDPNWLDPHVQLAALYYKVHRPADGERERQIVTRLSGEPRP
jgi:tetratricopeptide (TPR) repeat protein